MEASLNNHFLAEPAPPVDPAAIAARTPVIGRIRDGALILDLRALEDDGAMLAALA